MEYTLQDYTECDHFGTVTLKPELYELPISEQIKKTLQPLFTILKQFSTNFLLTLELTKTNNLHYHFICKTKDSELDPFMFCDALRTYNWKHKRNIFGFAEYELMKSWEKSALYITKDIKKTTAKIGQKAWYDHKHMFMKSIVKKKPKNIIAFDDDIIILPKKAKQTLIHKQDIEKHEIMILNDIIEQENLYLDHISNLDKDIDI